MDQHDLRSIALRQASDDEKHSGGSGVSFVTAPNAGNVIARAEAYLKFLRGEKRAPAKKKR